MFEYALLSRKSVIALTITLFASPTAVHAELIGPTDRIQLRIHGQISQHCAMGSPGSVDFGDLTRTGVSAEVRVPFDCNVPFDVRVDASNGALANLNAVDAGPFARSLPYTLDVTVPVRRPSRGVVNHSFDSRDLRGSQTLSSGGGIALDGMTLRVALGRPASEAGLLAGDYSEMIIISVSPS